MTSNTSAYCLLRYNKGVTTDETGKRSRLEEIPPIGSVEAILRTCDRLDPQARGVLVGSAALRLRGLRIPVNDVDMLLSTDDMRELNNQIITNNAEGAFQFSPEQNYEGVRGERVSLTPLNDCTKLFLPCQAFSEISDEAYQMTYTEALSGNKKRDISGSVQLHGRNVLSPYDVLVWGLSVGREKDIFAAKKALSQELFEDKFTSSERRVLGEMVAVASRHLNGERGRGWLRSLW